MTKNTYDRTDMIRRNQVLVAGPLKIAEYQVRDPETDEFGDPQFHMTFNNMVLGVMGLSAAKLFAQFIDGSLGRTPDHKKRVDDLLEANNRYLQRARDAEAALALLQKDQPVKVAP